MAGLANPIFKVDKMSKGIKIKKGDIPVTILVIGVFAVCTLALLSFVDSTYKTGENFEKINLVEKANSNEEAYLFYKNSGSLNNEIKKSLNVISYGKKDKIYLEKNVSESFFVFWKKPVLDISIEHELP